MNRWYFVVSLKMKFCLVREACDSTDHQQLLHCAEVLITVSAILRVVTQMLCLTGINETTLASMLKF